MSNQNSPARQGRLALPGAIWIYASQVGRTLRVSRGQLSLLQPSKFGIR